MRLLTNSNNINSLKLLIAADVAGQQLEVAYLAPARDARDVLPVLEVGSARLFLPSAAALLLLPDARPPDEALLEFETNNLYPAVVSVLASCLVGKPGPDAALVAQLKALLVSLEQRVEGEHLVQGGLGVEDILVFCDLLPFMTDSKLRKEVVGARLGAWWDRLAKHKSFAASTAKFGAGLEGCRSATSSLYTQARLVAGQPAVTPAGGGVAEAPVATQAAVSQAEVAAAKAGWSSPVPEVAARLGPVLPHKGERNILITSALPYVNNVPHLGNIVGCVLSADVYARFARLRGYNVLYVCGTDEYGTSTETKAVEEGLTPRQICDKYNKLHTEIYEWFGISFDKFGRTTGEHQTTIAQDIFWSLHKAGCTSTADVDQLYCCSCKRFLADRFVEGVCPLCGFDDARGDQCDACGKLINASELVKPRCKLCSRTPEVRTSGHIFLDLPKVEPQLAAWLEASAERWTSNARTIAKSWVKGGLQPRCITRDLVWGTPVPLEGYTDKVFYVWFDAPIGYIAITAQYTEHWEKWWRSPESVEYWQFMAKDNVPFHAVVFPSTLLGTGEPWTKVTRLMSTEYLNYEDSKFSKSRGIGVFGNDAQDTGIPADVWRFYLMAIRPESQDSAFKWEDLMTKVNAELLANLGNFVNRATKFTKDNFGSKVPEMALTNEDWELVARVNQELSNYITQLEDAREREAITTVFNISRLGNQLMQHNTPWKLVKGSAEDRARAGTVVGLSVNLACLLCVLIQPYMPAMAARLEQQLAVPAGRLARLPTTLHCFLPAGHSIGEPSPLVEEIKPALVEQLKARYQGKQADRQGTPQAEAADPAAVARLEAEVAEQAAKVREVKAAKAEKAVVDAEVKVLLELKQKLGAVQGGEAKQGKKGKKK